MGNQTLKMKLSQLLIALFAIKMCYTAQGLPLATSYYMGNNDGATTCSSCFNYGPSTKIGPKILNGSNLCLTALANTVTDCKYYKGTSTSTKSFDDCVVCNSKDWWNLTDNAVASSVVVTCSDTAVDPAVCTTKVSN